MQQQEFPSLYELHGITSSSYWNAHGELFLKDKRVGYFYQGNVYWFGEYGQRERGIHYHELHRFMTYSRAGEIRALGPPCYKYDNQRKRIIERLEERYY